MVENNYSINTPVALFIFLREKTVLQIIDILRELNAKTIYLIGEGPRPNRDGEEEEVRRIRNVIEKAIDWECTIRRDYAEADIGAGHRISSGITYVLSQENEAIFLEDDILPTKDFFIFCESLLEKYRYDSRIMAVCGCNMIQNYATDDSYLFCQIPFPWGWATWKRAWQGYDYYIKSWNELKETKFLKPMFPDTEIYRQKAREWDLAYNGIDFTWDYQFAYHIMINSGLVIVPKENLIKYQGFDDVATNSSMNKFENRAGKLVLPFKHPRVIARNYSFEKEYYNIWLYNNKMLRKKAQLYIKRLLNIFAKKR